MHDTGFVSEAESDEAAPAPASTPSASNISEATTAFTVSLIKSAVCEAAACASVLNMSEADLGLCVAAQLREYGLRVAHEYAVVPHWTTSRGARVPLAARRADLAVWRHTDEVLVELKMVTSTPPRVDDRHRRQAAAYAEIEECPCLLAVVSKGGPGTPLFEEFEPGHYGTGTGTGAGV
jgi:hypothetical protein